jgi:Domain of unknown function (DUF4157)
MTLRRKGTQPSTLDSQPSKVPPIVHEVLRSPGQRLDADTRAFMEPRFGHDFSNVRVHADGAAAESARAVNALAYTVGHDVVFGGGLYQPGTIQGQRLLAHELTHTIQQRTGLQPASFVLETAAPESAPEREAYTLAESVVAHRPTVRTVHKQAGQLARQRLDGVEPTQRDVTAVAPVIIHEPGALRTAPLSHASAAHKPAPANKTTLGIGITKTKEFFKKKKTALMPNGIVTVTLVGSGTLTVSPEASNVTISDKEFNLELEKLGMSIKVAPGDNNFTFSSKFGGISPTVSTKISFEMPNKTIYSTENTVVSYKREGRKVEGTLNLELITEANFIDRLRPERSPEPVPWYLLLLAFIEEGGWVVVVLI